MQAEVLTDDLYNQGPGPVWYSTKRSLEGPKRTVAVDGVVHRLARYGLKFATLCRSRFWDSLGYIRPVVGGAVTCPECKVVAKHGGLFVNVSIQGFHALGHGRQQIRSANGSRVAGCYRVTKPSGNGS